MAKFRKSRDNQVKFCLYIFSSLAFFAPNVRWNLRPVIFGVDFLLPTFGLKLSNRLTDSWGEVQMGGLRPLSVTRAQPSAIVHICGLFGPSVNPESRKPTN